MTRSALLNVMVQTARKVGRGLSRDFGEIEQLQISMKGTEDYVFASQRKAWRTLIYDLEKARPGYSFLFSDNHEIQGNDKSHRWLVALLNGRNNFRHALPFFSVSIALEREKQIVSALVYNPILNELFTTEKSKGVFFNDKRLRVTTRMDLDTAMVICDIPDGRQALRPHERERNSAIASTAAFVRSLGSEALGLAFVATGRADAYFKNTAHLCDIAAGILLIREAGGFVSTPDGKTHDMNDIETGIIAGNETIQKNLVRLLNLPKERK
ncbi:MAG: inositol monophosphatase [Alphaproteobacteria bacterium]|nr:inositol monophosphatase [Alphaproteobacteria bacterium]